MTILRFHERFADKIIAGSKSQTFRRGDAKVKPGDGVQLRRRLGDGQADADLMIPPSLVWQVQPMTIHFSAIRGLIETISINGAALGPLESEAFAILDGFEPVGIWQEAETALEEMGQFFTTLWPEQRVVTGHLIQWVPMGGFDQVADNLFAAVTLAKERLDVA